jgi:HEAT repeat protein
MLAPELTLDAALRDVGSRKQEFRYHAAENLARALLHELGKPGPRWHAAAEHPRGPAVLAALRELCDEREPAVLRGTAAVGLGMLGEPEVLELTAGWIALPGDDEDQAFLRESAVMAAARLHRAAVEAGADPEVRQRIRARVAAALRAEAPDLRYQGALALVELAGDEAEAPLVDALRREEHSAVREGLVQAIAHLDPPGPRACDALEALLAGPDAQEGIGFEAALALAAARRTSARPRLLQALPVRGHRDRAL